MGIVTPALIIGGMLNLDAETPYLVSMSLIASGIGTLIQAIQPFGIGAKCCACRHELHFVGVIVSVGLSLKEGGGNSTELLGLTFGLCMVGSCLQIALSPFIPKLKNIITPLVTGIVVISIGVSLIKVAMTDLAGGFNAVDFGSPLSYHWACRDLNRDSDELFSKSLDKALFNPRGLGCGLNLCVFLR